jgi:hypothetical protein
MALVDQISRIPIAPNTVLPSVVKKDFGVVPRGCLNRHPTIGIRLAHRLDRGAGEFPADIVSPGSAELIHASICQCASYAADHVAHIFPRQLSFVDGWASKLMRWLYELLLMKAGREEFTSPLQSLIIRCG